ncbi:IgGFc-binding protein-like [Mizuhopecten yessoensis]|uniref:IgGFc-binding protein-like n=1 Tax=Mizuhopecten yessoensis TaxID=6573 RepID=UPI000B45CB75|nr:IgGFc-binding protein-like [Mizuhopecten yessoensis]
MSTTGTDHDAKLYISNPHSRRVTVRVRSSPKLNIDALYRVDCGTVRTIRLSSAFGAQEGTSIEPKGVLVTSDNEVALSCANVNDDSYDAFLALPTDVLGTHYHADTYYPCGDACQALVVSVHNATKVSITMGSSLGNDTVEYNGTRYATGDTLNVVLNQYEMFQFHSLGDLSGTHIVSNKVISVFSGNKHTSVGSKTSYKTNLVEQLTPVKTWGKTFVLVPTPETYHSSFFRFLASDDSTAVRIRGDCFFNLNMTKAGEVARIEVPLHSNCYGVANRPIQVVKYTQGHYGLVVVDNPSMILIPPTEQFSSTYTYGNAGESRAVYLILILKSEDLDGLRFDGKIFSSSSARIENIMEIKLMIVQVLVSSHQAHTVRHISPNVTFGGTIYGFFYGYVTYGYPIGMRMVAINNPCETTVPEVGDGIDNDCDGMVDEELCGVDSEAAVYSNDVTLGNRKKRHYESAAQRNSIVFRYDLVKFASKDVNKCDD